MRMIEKLFTCFDRLHTASLSTHDDTCHAEAQAALFILHPSVGRRPALSGAPDLLQLVVHAVTTFARRSRRCSVKQEHDDQSCTSKIGVRRALALFNKGKAFYGVKTCTVSAAGCSVYQTVHDTAGSFPAQA
jgi:hypothetical protein